MVFVWNRPFIFLFMPDSPRASPGTPSPQDIPAGRRVPGKEHNQGYPTVSSSAPSAGSLPSAPSSSQSAPPDTGIPAIRTMKSDIDRLFKTTPPSVAQMISKPAATHAAAKKQTRIAGVYIALGAMVALLLIAGGGAYYFRTTLFPPAVPVEIMKAPVPQPFFATESSRTLEVAQTKRQKFLDLMNDAMKEFERDGTIKRILIKRSDTPDQHYMSLAEFFDFYHINPPENLIRRLESDLMIFVYTTTNATRLGLAVRTTDSNRTLRDMLDWEQSMSENFKPLLFDQQFTPATLSFEDRSYHNIDWRFLKLSSDTDIGIGYTIFPSGNILIITTSRQAMETVINRLFDAR